MKLLRWLWLRLPLCLALTVPAWPLAVHAFGFEDVAKRARDLAGAKYKTPVSLLPPELRDLGYDAYRDIRYRPERAVWRQDRLPFELMFFHPGRNFQEAVRINTLEPNGVRRVEFDPEAFDYGRNHFDPKKLRNLGYAGFRVHYAINRPAYKDEVLVFLGASYFRAVGKGEAYGLSARGLAIDTAAAPGEDFARFTEFWIERPRPNATSLVLYALLDSERMTGAYRFVLTPGADTVTQVTARVFPREQVAKLGIAPLNSMFLFGANQPGPADDYRSEVHDSDGLSIANGNGEWIWRPLTDPKRLLVTSFVALNPKGFGLMQRNRYPGSYEDPETLYERRPSGWVEPVGNWGTGRVELVQIPTPDETNDNIVAYWVADAPPKGKAPINFAYKLHWQLPGQTPPDRGWVVQTLRGHGYAKLGEGEINFLVDFDGPVLRDLKPDAKPEPVVDIGGNAELRERNLFRNQSTGTWRLTLRVKRIDDAKPVELRAQIKTPNQVLTETWSYIVPPESEKP
ncbi:MAG: glucan biosynthesis protein G [Pseudomonadota bacterium]|nr:glucan biosynthesis protein G [Pseudomonadota bacterium]